jgi:UDP-N-acetylmuramoyl-L-alanyl-D-glutamate--2,6-diaminopimelate ligase
MYNICTNSRHLKNGDVFFCNEKAIQFLNYEVMQKASKVFLPEGIKVSSSLFNEKIEYVPNLHKRLVEELQKRYKLPSKIFAITGTKGKTSSAWFVFQILTLNRINSSYFGTIGCFYSLDGQIFEMEKGNTLTTLAIDDLYKKFDFVKNLNIEHSVIEASSHGLLQGRLDGIEIDVSCFTNFSQDHLDYHKSMEEYFEAKTLLFRRKSSKKQFAVLNADIKEFATLKNICKQNDHNILSFGESEVTDLQFSLLNNSLKVTYKGVAKVCQFNVIGSFQGGNIVAAICICLQAGFEFDAILKTIPQVKAPVGRMEQVFIENTPFNVFVDYAHSPDSLEKALKSLQSLGKRIICVFGCGGDRDKTKRPIMGAISYKLADCTILTSDNSRSEKTEDIINDIMAGIVENNEKKSVIVIADREKAIAKAIEIYNKNTLVLIAGKGHEKYQIICGLTTHFDDVQVAKTTLATCLNTVGVQAMDRM